MRSLFKFNSKGQRPGSRLHAKKPNHHGGPRRDSVCQWDCGNVKKLQEELLAYCHLTTALFCSWCIPKFSRQRKTKKTKTKKTAIRLKQSPCVLISMHLHENSSLWSNSSRWVQRPMWCYGPSEGSPQCTPRAQNLPCLDCIQPVWPALLIVNVSSLPRQLTNKNF